MHLHTCNNIVSSPRRIMSFSLHLFKCVHFETLLSDLDNFFCILTRIDRTLIKSFTIISTGMDFDSMINKRQ